MTKKKMVIMGFLIVVIIALISIFAFYNKIKDNFNDIKYKKIELGDIVELTKEDKELLREETIKNLKNSLKSPASARFEEKFHYSCEEENIIKVNGYVDSQNSFGALIRGYFVCEYFAIDNDMTTLIYFSFNDEEILDIKDATIKEYKKQAELKDLNENEDKLNQKKLEYIKEKFNNDEINDVGRIREINFDENESYIEVQIIANTEYQTIKNYWINFNICSILDYLKESEIIGTVKIKLYDKNKIVEVTFDEDFIKNKWKNNKQIDKVEEIFGDNYKEI